MVDAHLERLLKEFDLDANQLPRDLSLWTAFVENLSFLCNTNQRPSKVTNLDNRLSEHNLFAAGNLSTLSSLALSIIHELNNPLTAIKAYSEIIKKHSQPKEKIHNSAEKIYKMSIRMTETINSLVKLSNNRHLEKKSRFTLERAIEESIESVKPFLQKEDIDIEWQPHSTEHFIDGSYSLIVSVFQNLLINSLDAFSNITTSKQIKITVAQRENSVAISFEDNACGIEDDVLSKIFDPFFTTKANGTASGLGLSLAKQTIEEHKGLLSVKSQKGQGSCFEVTLPLSEISQFQNGQIIRSHIKQKKQRMLIVEDECDILDLLADLFSDTFDVTAESHTPTAMEKIENEHFDIIITDLKMPIITGQKLASRARQKHPSCKIIAISGQVESEIKTSLKNAHPYLFIKKPFPPMESLYIIIQNYIDVPIDSLSA